jgi:hypothetical protein
MRLCQSQALLANGWHRRHQLRPIPNQPHSIAIKQGMLAHHSGTQGRIMPYQTGVMNLQHTAQQSAGFCNIRHNLGQFIAIV